MTEASRPPDLQPRAQKLEEPPLLPSSGFYVPHLVGGTLQSKEEMNARLELQAKQADADLADKRANADLSRRLRLIGSIVLMVALSLLALFAAGLLVWSEDPEARKWAMTILSSVLTGAVSFIAGRGMAQKGSE